jgi:hypothetical protein
MVKLPGATRSDPCAEEWLLATPRGISPLEFATGKHRRWSDFDLTMTDGRDIFAPLSLESCFPSVVIIAVREFIILLGKIAQKDFLSRARMPVDCKYFLGVAFYRPTSCYFGKISLRLPNNP